MGLSVHLTRRGPTFGEARDFLGLAVLALPLALVLARFEAVNLFVAHLAAVPAGAQLTLLALLVAVVVVAVVAPVASFSVLLVALVASGLLVTLSSCKPRRHSDHLALTLG